MTTTFTRTEVEAMIEADTAAYGTDDFDVGLLAALLDSDAQPANMDFVEALGADYIGALDDGTIVAWGRDFGRDQHREVVFINPADQVVADESATQW